MKTLIAFLLLSSMIWISSNAHSEDIYFNDESTARDRTGSGSIGETVLNAAEKVLHAAQHAKEAVFGSKADNVHEATDAASRRMETGREALQDAVKTVRTEPHSYSTDELDAIERSKYGSDMYQRRVGDIKEMDTRGPADKARDAYESAKDKASDAYDRTSDKVRDATRGPRDAYESAKDKASDAYDRTADKVRDATRGPRDAYESAKDKASDAYDRTADKAREAYDKTADKAKEAYDKTKDTAYYAYDRAADKAREAYDKTADKAKEAMDATADRAKEAYDKTKDTAYYAYDRAADKVREAYDKTADKAKEAMDATADRAKEAYDATKDTAYYAYDRAADRLKETYDTVTEKAADTAKLAAEKAKDAVSNAAEKTASATKEGLETASHGLKHAAVRALDLLRRAIHYSLSTVESTVEAAKDRVSTPIEETEAISNMIYGKYGDWTEDEQKQANLDLRVAISLMEKGQNIMDQVSYECKGVSCKNNEEKIRRVHEAEQLYQQGIYRVERLLRRKMPKHVSLSLQNGVTEARNALFEAQEMIYNMTAGAPIDDKYHVHHIHRAGIDERNFIPPQHSRDDL